MPELGQISEVDAKLAHAVGSITGASLTELWAKEKLPEALFDAANEPRLWGHVAAHDDFDPSEITPEHVEDLLGFLDIVPDMVYLTPAKLEHAIGSRKTLANRKIRGKEILTELIPKRIPRSSTPR